MALGTQKATGTSGPMDDSVSPVESALLAHDWNQSWTWGSCPRTTPLCLLLGAGMGQLRSPSGLPHLALGSKNTADDPRMARYRNVECATAHCFPSVLPLLTHFGDQVTNRGFSWAGDVAQWKRTCLTYTRPWVCPQYLKYEVSGIFLVDNTILSPSLGLLKSTRMEGGDERSFAVVLGPLPRV